MEFLQPPPEIHNNTGGMGYNVPPPMHRINQMSTLNATKQNHYHHHFHHQNHYRSFNSFNRGPGAPMSQDDFDGKRLRKSVMRKTVDYNAAIVRSLENRIWQRDARDRPAVQPESIYIPHLQPPPSYLDNPINAVTTKFVKTATNKMRCPIFTLAWTPEGRRLVTGASSGEFTLWNGLTFNFETILQAHDVPVRTMHWSHNDNWMVTGDHSGFVKYWQSNMNNVRMFQAHKEAVRGISFSPSDNKFVTCSDDGTLKVFDFQRCQEEKVLRGHGADVKCVHWHPQKSLIVSGSKDNQQPIKLWDPKSGLALATLHAHKSTVMDLRWNSNGNWLITASRDHLLKLFDLRNLSEEVQIFRGHKKEASCVTWHPVHEGLFGSGGSDGSILFWNVGTDKEVGAIDTAHDSIVWTLQWHPLGHILCSGSNDHTVKFWTRNRPGDQMRDKYNLNTLPAGLASMDDCEIDENISIIPGMGPEDKVEGFDDEIQPVLDNNHIPGLDLDPNSADNKRDKEKKVPYSKPIPRNFQAQWNEMGRGEDEESGKDLKETITQIAENTPGAVPLQKIAPSAIMIYNRIITVQPGSKLEKVISEGPDALNKYISSGEIEELNDVIPHFDDEIDDDSSNNSKRFRFDDDHDHKAKLIYNDDSNTDDNSTAASFIPPLMALNINLNPPNGDLNFRPTTNDTDARVPKDTTIINPWQSVPSPWTATPQFPPNIMNQQPNILNITNNPFNVNLPQLPTTIGTHANWTPNLNQQRPVENFRSKEGRSIRESGRPSRFDNADRTRRMPQTSNANRGRGVNRRS